MRPSLSCIKILAALLPLLTATMNCFAGLPSEIRIQESGLGSSQYSVSTKGDVFAILRESSGSIFVQAAGQSVEIPAMPSDAFPSEARKHLERVAINPDGRFVFRFARGHVVIRSLPDASIVWKGIPGNNQWLNSGHAYYFSAVDRRLLIPHGNNLLTFYLPEDGPATQVGVSPVTFTEPERWLYGNFVQAAVFTADGKTLFVGNMDGEVLALDVGEKNPRVRWRAQVFKSFKRTGFSDDADRYASRLQCADECRKLVVHSYRAEQVAVLDAEKGEVLGRASSDSVRLQLVGIGDGRFAMLDATRFGKNIAVVNEKLEAALSLDFSGDPLLLFGFSDGFAGARSSTPGWTVFFTDVNQKIAEIRRQKEAEAAEAEADLKRQTVYRRKLKSGDDSNCGLVIERKGEIALVETMIGQKWLKIGRLYMTGTRGCRFVNGVLQE